MGLRFTRPTWSEQYLPNIDAHTFEVALHNGQLSIKRIFCGIYHNAAIASDGNLYTWGSNKHSALGSSNLETEKIPFTPNPGTVIEFGMIVNCIGRVFPRSIACGHEYTITIL